MKDAIIVHKYLLAQHLAQWNGIRFGLYEYMFYLTYINDKPLFASESLDEMISFLKDKYDIKW